MWQDVRYAARLLSKSPGFTVIAVLVIALGIGPNTAIFSMINAVLLRPMSYPNADRVVMLWENWKSRGFDILPVSGPTFLDWKAQSRSFEDMAPAFTIPEYGFNVTANGEPVRAQGGQAAASFFRVLGVHPVIGREFDANEDRPGGAPVALLNYSFWQRQFGGDRQIIGRTIGLDGIGYTVVGVLPPEVESITKVDLWVPIARDLASERRDNHNFGIMARLKPGVTIAQARTEMEGIERGLAKRYPDATEGLGVSVVSINDVTGGMLRPALMLLLAAVGLLLLIACANIGGLMLARGAGRQKEIAVRTAMGAGRGRLVRQLLTESVLLALGGGILGLLAAAWCVRALRGFVPDLLPRLQQMDIDWRVLVFTLGVSVLTGILFGIAPAWRAARTDISVTLKESGGRGSVTGSGQRLRSVLLTVEVALSVVLLAGAALLARSFLRLLSVDPGFDPDRLLTMSLTMPEKKYPDTQKRAAFIKSVVERIETLPAVRGAAAVDVLPMRGRFLDMRVSVTGFQVEGQPAAERGREPTADYRRITPGYIKTMAIPLKRGRVFTDRDTVDARRVALINETLARHYFPGQDPIGRRLYLGSNTPYEIAGVVGDVRMGGLEKNADPAIYVPFAQNASVFVSLVLRGAGDVEGLTAAVRREIHAADSEQPVSDVRTMNGVIGDAMIVRRLASWMLGVFAVLALTLASVGIYGLVSYSVAQRVQEIGLRMALGAQPADIMRTVVRRGLLISLLGVAAGLPAALFLAQFMRGLLFGVTASDPLVFAGVAAVLVTVACVASYIPARRAMRIEPTEALHYQ